MHACKQATAVQLSKANLSTQGGMKVKVVKPHWLCHAGNWRELMEDEKNKKTLPIFSLDFHPSLDKLATGGIDMTVRIWSTLGLFSSPVDSVRLSAP